MTIGKKPARATPDQAGEATPLPEAVDPSLPELQPEIASASAIADQPLKPPRSGGTSPLLAGMLGGAVVAFAGLALVLGGFIGQPTALLDALAANKAAQSQTLSALESRIAALEAALPPDLSRLDALELQLQTVEAQPQGSDDLARDLAARLEALEAAFAAAPVPEGTPAEIEAALARVAALEAEAAAATEAAEEAALAAETARAREALTEAVASGTSFAAELTALADPKLTATLSPHAAGVTPLTELQVSFPDAARAVLDLARQSDGDAGWANRLTDFLADQTGARSVTPREGTDPDAILSRAEFALGEGRLADALAELQTLPADIRAPLEAWITQAKARAAVDAALRGAL